PQQLDLLALPVAELTACEVRIVEDGVKAGRFAVIGIAVAGGAKVRGAEANPVPVVGKFQRPHPRVNVLPAAGNRIERVGAGDVITGLADVDPVDMPFARKAQSGLA